MQTNLPTRVEPESRALAFFGPAVGDQYCLVEAYLATLNTDTGRRGMKSAIRRVAELYFEGQSRPDVPAGVELWQFVPWHLMNAAAVRNLMSRFGDAAPATKNKALSALKGIARAGHDRDVIPTATFSKIESVRGFKGKRVARGRDIAEEEFEALVAACRSDKQKSGWRDAAMIAFAFATGARREELTSLTMDRIEDATSKRGEVLTGTLRGKGDKERTFYVFNGNRALVLEWLAVRGDAPGFVFCRTGKGGSLYPEQPISTNSAHAALMHRVKQAGVSGLTWHDFRRTVAGDLLDRKVDISTVAAVLGHSSVTTTQRYDRRGEEAKMKAMSIR